MTHDEIVLLLICGVLYYCAGVVLMLIGIATRLRARGSVQCFALLWPVILPWLWAFPVRDEMKIMQEHPEMFE